jgi:hypothetical protein
MHSRVQFVKQPDPCQAEEIGLSRIIVPGPFPVWHDPHTFAPQPFSNSQQRAFNLLLISFIGGRFQSSVPGPRNRT